MGALVADVVFPISDKPILTAWRIGLASWSGLSIERKRPATLTKRVITLRNDSGPQANATSLRRYGVNVFADESADCENLALDAMREARRLAGIGPIKATNSFNGPFEVEDDPDFTFSGTPMFHFYFTFAAVVKGSKPA